MQLIITADHKGLCGRLRRNPLIVKQKQQPLKLSGGCSGGLSRVIKPRRGCPPPPPNHLCLTSLLFALPHLLPPPLPSSFYFLSVFRLYLFALFVFLLFLVVFIFLFLLLFCLLCFFLFRFLFFSSISFSFLFLTSSYSSFHFPYFSFSSSSYYSSYSFLCSSPSLFLSPMFPSAHPPHFFLLSFLLLLLLPPSILDSLFFYL